jgi:STE24 endopeptidase
MNADTIEQAAASWLTTVDPVTLQLATRYTQGGHWLLLWEALITIALSLLLVRSRIASRVAHRFERRGRSIVFCAFSVSGVVLLALSALALPWDFYVDWYRERQYGLTDSSPGAWFIERLIEAVLLALVLGLFFGLFYGLLRVIRRHRSLWLGLLTAAFMTGLLLIYPVAIAPLFNTFEPAPPGGVREAASALAHRAGIRSEAIFVYDGSTQSNRYTASVKGIGNHARILLSDTMFRDGVDLQAIEAVVAHEIGHYAEHHVAWSIAFYAIFVAGLFALLQLLFPRAALLIYRGAAPRIEDPAGLPVIIVLFTMLSLLATPIESSFRRLLENRADAYSLNLAREPDGLIRALLRTVDYRAPQPSSIEEAVFYDHPSIAHRIEVALRWKAANTQGDFKLSPSSSTFSGSSGSDG